MLDVNKLYNDVYKQSIHKINRILNLNFGDAEDIVQQAFLNVMKYQDKYDPEKGTPKVWFNKILYSELKDFKAPGIEHINLDDELLDGRVKPEVIFHIDNSINEVANYRHRRILELFYRNGYSTNEIAKIMSCSRSNVTTVCNRFKKNLAERYGEYL